MKHPETAGLLDFGSPADYRPLDLEPPRPGTGGALLVGAEELERLAFEAFSDMAFRLPAAILEGWASIVADPAASEAERFVACELIANAAVAAEGLLPLCQDTGTALVHGWKGGEVSTPGSDAEALAAGAARAWKSRGLRASILAPRGFLEEANTGDNLPLEAELEAAPRGTGYRLCFSAKGGGSANRTSLRMASPALLEPASLGAWLSDAIGDLGTSGCPPYRVSLVVGGASPEAALRALSLAGLGLLDGLPATGPGDGSPLRDRGWEERIMSIAAATGIGAQFGGSRMALDARAIRLPRHAASLPLALGVRCSAGRRARALVDPGGYRLERLEEDPARFLPAESPLLPGAVDIDLDRPPREVADRLALLPAGSFLRLSGTVVVARDAAHARFAALLARGESPPDYLSRHAVFYAGPTEAAPGQVSGSFGPTTAGRMDAWLPTLLGRGASLVTIAKGGRSEAAARAIAEAGGAYLAVIGGAAALAARRHVAASRVIDHADLGMEAVRLVELRGLPAMLAVDARGRRS